MTLFWNILQSIITIIEIRVCVWMMESFAKPRYRGRKQKIVVWIVTLGVGGLYAANRWMAAYYSRIILVVVFAILCVAIFRMFLYFREAAIFMTANYLLIGGLLDLMIMVAVEIITHKPGLFIYIDYINDKYRMGIMVISKILLFLSFWMVRRQVNKKVVYQLEGKKISLVCIILCIIEYAGVHILTEILSRDRNITYDLLIRLIFCLIVIFLMLIIMGIVVLYYDKKDQLKQKSIYLESLDFENQRIIRLYREREVMYHDFKNHLFLLDTYVQNGEIEQFREYMNSIKKPFLEKPMERRTGHNVMDLILNYKISEAQNRKIKVNCNIRGYMTFQLVLTDEEVCSLLGNLWDNAIEACEKLEEQERWIDFQMRITEDKFLLEISNPCFGITKKADGGLLTTKKNKELHGVGVRTIKSITESHGGYFNYVYVLDEHAFRVEVMIYND